jgi:hypothetical protein
MENHAKINMTSSSFPNQTRLKRFLCAFIINILETLFLSQFDQRAKLKTKVIMGNLSESC